jgi:hypothetical protein
MSHSPVVPLPTAPSQPVKVTPAPPGTYYNIGRFVRSPDAAALSPELAALQPSTANTTQFCTWSTPPYTYPYWAAARAKAMIDTVRVLNEAGVVYFLTGGCLIGAWRHGGPVPCDGDMDIVFPVWLNGLATCTDVAAGRPTLRGYSQHDESKLTLCGARRDQYVALTADWLRRRVPGIRSIAPRPFGGVRVDFAGIGVDWIVSILDQAYLYRGPMCRCQFGDVDAWCLEGAEFVLKEEYGVSVGAPDAKVAACLRHELTLPAGRKAL